MTTRQVLLHLGRFLRATAAPLVTLGALALARAVPIESPMSAAVDDLVLLAWRAAVIATVLWLFGAVTWPLTRPRRDCRAFQRLQRLREISTPPNRALVHVQTTVWSSTAGQHAVVVNVATGAASRVWLPETTVPIGAFVVLERTDGGVKVVDWMNAHQVEAGHRHEMCRERSNVAIGLGSTLEHGRNEGEAACELVRETEEFLRSQSSG